MTLLSRLERRIRIVLADGNAEFRALFRELIGHQTDMEIVCEVVHGDDVFAVALQQLPDVLLLSLEIEGTSGYSLLEQFQAAGLGTRVIAVCGNSRMEHCVQAVRLGCRGLLPEGTEGSLVLKCIRKVYEGELWLDRATTSEVLRHLTQQPPANSKARVREEKASPLSPREREIVLLVTQGFRNKELAEKLVISEQTVKNHMHNIFDKLGVSDRLELALYAIHNGLHL